jgi:hypothetical protein
MIYNEGWSLPVLCLPVNSSAGISHCPGDALRGQMQLASGDHSVGRADFARAVELAEPEASWRFLRRPARWSP